MTTTVDPFGATQDQDAEAFFEGGNISAVFPKVGFVLEGNVLGYRMMQQSDHETRELLWRYNGKSVKETEIPEANGVRARVISDRKNEVRMMVIDIEMDAPTFETWETREYIHTTLDEDSGVRSLYINKPALKFAIGKAIKDAGHRLPEIGSRLKVTRTASHKTPRGFMAQGFSAEYLPAARNPKYTPPAADASPEDDPWS